MTEPVIDRSGARAEIRARLEAAARAQGYASHEEAMDADYAEWQERVGL